MEKKSSYTIKTTEMLIAPMDDNDIWEGEWIITLRDSQIPIGKATFKGPKALGAVPLTVELEERYQNKGYGTEVFKALVRFAFGYKNIYEITAKTDRDNDKCIYALEKAGFVYRKVEDHTEDYSIIKPKSAWLGLYLYIGLLIGLALVLVFGGSWVGLIIGLVLGITGGLVMENKEKRDRERVLGRKED